MTGQGDDSDDNDGCGAMAALTSDFLTMHDK